MSKYEVNALLSMWAQDKLTVEQAVGQILQHLQALLGRVGQVEKQVEQLRRQEERPTAVFTTTTKTAVIFQEVVTAPQPEAAESVPLQPQEAAGEPSGEQTQEPLPTEGLAGEVGSREERDESQFGS